MWQKQAQQIVDILSPVDLTRQDIDTIAYYVSHLASLPVVDRAVAFGDSLVYHNKAMQEMTQGRHEETEQLCLEW